MVVVSCGEDPKPALESFIAAASLQRDDAIVDSQGKDAVMILKTMGLTVPPGFAGRELELVLEKVALLDIMK